MIDYGQTDSPNFIKYSFSIMTALNWKPIVVPGTPSTNLKVWVRTFLGFDARIIIDYTNRRFHITEFKHNETKDETKFTYLFRDDYDACTMLDKYLGSVVGFAKDLDFSSGGLKS